MFVLFARRGGDASLYVRERDTYHDRCDIQKKKKKTANEPKNEIEQKILQNPTRQEIAAALLREYPFQLSIAALVQVQITTLVFCISYVLIYLLDYKEAPASLYALAGQ